MHLEQKIKDFADTFPKSKQTHRNMEKPTWSPSASYSPSIALFVASDPTLIARLVPASMNTKQERDCNIQMAIYFNQFNK